MINSIIISLVLFVVFNAVIGKMKFNKWMAHCGECSNDGGEDLVYRRSSIDDLYDLLILAKFFYGFFDVLDELFD